MKIIKKSFYYRYFKFDQELSIVLKIRLRPFITFYIWTLLLSLEGFYCSGYSFWVIFRVEVFWFLEKGLAFQEL